MVPPGRLPFAPFGLIVWAISFHPWAVSRCGGAVRLISGHSGQTSRVLPPLGEQELLGPWSHITANPISLQCRIYTELGVSVPGTTQEADSSGIVTEPGTLKMPFGGLKQTRAE